MNLLIKFGYLKNSKNLINKNLTLCLARELKKKADFNRKLTKYE